MKKKLKGCFDGRKEEVMDVNRDMFGWTEYLCSWVGVIARRIYKGHSHASIRAQPEGIC